MVEPLSFSDPNIQRDAYIAAFVADIISYRSDMTYSEIAVFLIAIGYNPRLVAAYLDPTYTQVRNFHRTLVDKVMR